jgi:hypothetical protein
MHSARADSHRNRHRELRPIYHPAGFDAGLRTALEELRAGRWLAMRDLLAATGTDWALRTSRTQVLAAAAAGTDVVRAWLTEEPASADGAVLRARVAVERALRAHRLGHAAAQAIVAEARMSCRQAAERAPADPVPWVGLLALARTDPSQALPEHRRRPPEPMLPPGPWGLLQQVQNRHPGNREAFHRVLHLLHARRDQSHGAQVDFVRWVVSWAPAGSPLLVLPLYAYAENYRHQWERGRLDPLMRRQWTREYIARDVRAALHGWFEHAGPDAARPDGPLPPSNGGFRSLSDLNHLAHALWASHQFTDAARVFEALGPFATRLPWAYVSNDPSRPELAEREFLRARAQSLAAGRQLGGDRRLRGPRPGSGAVWPPLPDEPGAGFGAPGPATPPGAPAPAPAPEEGGAYGAYGEDAAYGDPGAAGPYPAGAEAYGPEAYGAEGYGPYPGDGEAFGAEGFGPLPHPEETEPPVPEWEPLEAAAAANAANAADPAGTVNVPGAAQGAGGVRAEGSGAAWEAVPQPGAGAGAGGPDSGTVGAPAGPVPWAPPAS